jgi:hypothetical protein
VKLEEMAKVITSKNAGPFITTIDISFLSRELFLKAKNSGVMTIEHFAEIYGLRKEDVIGVYFVDAVMRAKISFLKSDDMISGDPHCRDLFGAQQWVLLMDMEIPV